MFPPNFTQQPEFKAFKHAIGHASALEFLFNLIGRCQVEKKTELHLPLKYVATTLGLPDGVDAGAVLAALQDEGMIKPIDQKKDMYLISLFTDQNRQLIAAWRNGSKGGRPGKVEGASDSTARPSSNSQDGEDIPW